MNHGQLHDVLDYDGTTGIFRWKITGRRITHVGMVAGKANNRGYIQIQLKGRKYKAHRLAWLYVYGRWPDGDLDHANRNPSDNRIVNLRLATKTQNQGNSYRRWTIKGVRLHRCGKWEARVQYNGKSEYLGLFPTQDAAKAAYIARARALFGEFARP